MERTTPPLSRRPTKPPHATTTPRHSFSATRPHNATPPPRHVTQAIERCLERTLKPMQDAMLLGELSLDLSDTQLQTASGAALAIKGHIVELTDGTKKMAFNVVNRELVEIQEAAETYLSIASIGEPEVSEVVEREGWGK